MSTEIAKPIDPMKDFQDRLAEQVRKDIRDLLPDDAVKGLVERAVTEEFFKPRIVKEGGFYGTEKQRPSWFVEAVVEAAKPLLQQAVKDYVARHPAEIDKAVEAFLEKNSLTMLAATMMAEQFHAAAHSVVSNIMQNR